MLGLDPIADGPRIRARLGVVPQQDTLDTELTVRENLLIYGRYFDLSRREAARRADELLTFVQLAERANDQVEPLSGGMKRRLTIARSLINEPSVLLLDEPTTGLDPQARHLLWDRLYRLKQRGVTLVLTTHYMDEAEQLCDRLVVMDKAKIVAEGSPRELIEQHSSREVAELRFAPDVRDSLDGQLEALLAGVGQRVEHLPDRVLVYADDGEAVAVAVHDRGLRARERAGPPEHARGRVPAPDRPDAGRVAPGRESSDVRRGPCLRAPPAGLPADVARHDLLARSCRRRCSSPRWASASAGTSTSPGAAAAPASRPGVAYAAFLAPGLLAANAMQTASTEATFPIAAAIMWIRQFPAMLATPITVRDIVIGQIAWWTVRLTTVAAIFVLVAAVMGAAHVARDRAGDPGRDPDGPRVRDADRRVHRAAQADRVLQPAVPVRDHADVPVQRHVLPDRPAARIPPADRAASRRCTTASR